MRAHQEDQGDRPAGSWDERYHRFQNLYNALEPSPQLLESLAAGLKAWAALLPVSETDSQGRHKAVNEWSLGPELSQLPIVVSMLRLHGDGAMADDVGRQVDELTRTARRLDGCYPKRAPDDDAAEARIVVTAKGRAVRLAGLTERLIPTLFGCGANWRDAPHMPIPLPPPQPDDRAPVRRRTSRATAIDAIRRELMAFMKASAAHMAAAEAMGRPAEPLPRPTMAELGRLAGVKRWTVSRCLADPMAQELQMLWRAAASAEWTRKLARR